MGKISPKSNVVCDAGPIIHLDELECLHLMSDFERVYIPDLVRKEVLQHRSIDFERYKVNWIDVSNRYPLEEPFRTMCRVFSLDAGEVAALEVLSRESDLVFLTDDAAARLVVLRLGYRVHGTIGVLVRAVRSGMMSPEELIDFLNRIPLVSTLHIRVSLLEEVIFSVKKEYGL